VILIELEDYIFYKYIKKVLDRFEHGLIKVEKFKQYLRTFDNWEWEALMLSKTKRERLKQVLKHN
jgi:hypothetical protein